MWRTGDVGGERIEVRACSRTVESRLLDTAAREPASVHRTCTPAASYMAPNILAVLADAAPRDTSHARSVAWCEPRASAIHSRTLHSPLSNASSSARCTTHRMRRSRCAVSVMLGQSKSTSRGCALTSQRAMGHANTCRDFEPAMPVSSAAARSAAGRRLTSRSTFRSNALAISRMSASSGKASKKSRSSCQRVTRSIESRCAVPTAWRIAALAVRCSGVYVCRIARNCSSSVLTDDRDVRGMTPKVACGSGGG